MGDRTKGSKKTTQRATTGSSTSTTSIPLPKELGLPGDTPSWGVAIFQRLNELIKKSNQEVNTQISELINVSIKAADDKAEIALNLAQTHQSTIDSLVTKVESLTNTIECLKNQNQQQNQHIVNLESYGRRENLIFRGFQPTEQPCLTTVHKIMQQMGVENSQHIQFERCHYLENRREIIARFSSFRDRERVWGKRFNLKGSQLYVAENFPRSILAERKQLYPVFNAAKVLPEYQRKVTIINNKLKLKDKEFTVDNLHTVPNHINPSTLAVRDSPNVHVFGGTTSRYCHLSNFYTREFVYDHQSFVSVEQAYQFKKATIAKDRNKCREILFNADPSTQKYLGRQVKGLDIDQWNNSKLDYMKDILIAKYTQHSDLKDTLIATGNKQIAEANSRDDYYGVGLPLTHKDILDPTAWRGQNNLGKLLMEIRKELQ